MADDAKVRKAQQTKKKDHRGVSYDYIIKHPEAVSESAKKEFKRVPKY